MQNKSQKEIAKILNVSEPTVSRLLKRAKKENVVSFLIQEPYADCLRIEKMLKTKYSLTEAIVVPPSEDQTDSEITKQAVALEGARYIQRIITPHDVLGIAWGGTMYYLIQYLNPCQKTRANFVTLHGSLSCCDYDLNVSTLVSRMAMAFGGKHYILTPEGLAGSSQTIQALRSESGIRHVFSWFNRITISVSGIGSLYPKADSPLSRLRYLKTSELSELRKEGVYGDLMLRFFDKNGEECETNLKDRTLAIDMDVYKRIPCKIIVASGVQKAYTLQAALKGGLANVVIVDYFLAKEFLNKSNQSVASQGT
jgi:deoxyribonucleoside regulator